LRFRKQIRYTSDNESVTVILPFRDEAMFLEPMLQRINSTILQNGDRWMLVDDGSLQIWTPKLPQNTSLIRLETQAEGSKKKALTEAISRTNSSIVCTTDADVLNHAGWIHAMSNGFNSESKMVIGPVLMTSNSNSLVSKVAALESLALLTVTLGSTGINLPLMCSGANLMFRRSAWNQVGGYAKHIDQPSGDDVLLMHDIWRKNRRSINAQISPEALVKTSAPVSWKAFFTQRKRWASKHGHLNHFGKIFLTLIIGCWLISPWFLLIFSWPILVALLVAEFAWISWLTNFYTVQFNWLLWLPFRLFYPLLFLVLPFFPPGKWKPA
jgi:cellulose synthase/poly-beta-1,6-N-acetylglucosamine synthase-like glycosyltransferase